MNRSAPIVAMLTLVAVTGGCAEETRVVREGKRFLESVPGAQVGGDDKTKDPPESNTSGLVAGVTSASLDQSRLPQPGEAEGASADEPPKDELVDTQPDGTITLKARSVREVMVHLSRVLSPSDDEAGERYRQAFTRDVLSSETIRHFRTQSKDAGAEALAYLRDNQAAINKLLTRMPAAENSPSVLFTSGGPNQFKLEVVGPAARGLKFTELWVANEKGQWKFVWAR